MTPQELKNSILQLAIQGKLVEQRPEEGTAEELYQQIQEDKQKLIREGKIKKEKPLPEITEDEKPYDIPESWKWVRIGSAFSIIMGQSPDGDSVSECDDGIEFHQGKIYFSKYIIEKSPYKTSMPTKLAPAHSLLICVRAPVGKVNITNRELCIGRGLSAIIPYHEMTVKFLFFWFSTLENIFVKQATGTTFKAISADIINNQLIPIPPLSEQKRIVAKIDELLPLIDRYEKAWNRLESFNKRFPDDLQKSLLQMAIQGKLVEQRPEEGTGEELYQQIQEEKQKLIREGKIKKEKPLQEITEEEKPFDIPENWKWVRFDVISNILGTGMIRAGNEQYNEAEYYYFKMNNIGNFDGKCHFENLVMVNASKEEFDRYKLEEDDFLFNTRNSKELVGKTAVVPPISQPIILNNNILKIHFLGGIVPKYINYYFLSTQGHTRLSSFVTSTTNVAAIYQRQLITFCVPLPPLAEQKRIVAKLEELLPLCEGIKQ